MGFFSSRKEDHKTTSSVARKEEKSVVQALRSRFSSKKGKEREHSPLSNHNALPTSSSASTNPFSGNKRNNRISVTASIIHRDVQDRAPPAVSVPEQSASTGPGHEPPTVRASRPSESSSLAQHSNASSPSIVPRRSVDAVTVTLAQRLNELASANSDGLLNDDEYRILRQNLFERFASNSVVPTENSVVPLHPAHLSTLRGNGANENAPSRPPSNFQIERPPFTKSSANSLFRRATERRTKDNETSSLMSTKSSTSLFAMPKLLSRKPSNASIRTSSSRVQTDAMSVSSRRHSSDKGHGDYPPPPSTPRSMAGSIRRMQVPPSSFNARLLSQDRNSAIYNVFDEDHLSTVQDIQQEISNVEAEQRRLMDAFNGLEITTLARAHRHRLPYRISGEFSKTSTTAESMSDSEGRFPRFPHLTDDGLSMRSGTSVKTSPSLAHSVQSSKNGLHVKGSLPSPLAASQTPLSLLRRKSMSNQGADDRKTPVPAVQSPLSHSYLQAASSSNVSLHSKSSRLAVNVLSDDRSMTTTQVDEKGGLEAELDDIRRRREEVSLRYQARLEYLQAKLKGAELHEKLMRR